MVVCDIELIECVKDLGQFVMNLYWLIEVELCVFCFKVYCVGDLIVLLCSLLMFEYFGVCVDEEWLYWIQMQDVVYVWVYDFGFEFVDDIEFDIECVKGLFEDVFDWIWSGWIENDDFNCFVLCVYLSVCEVMILCVYVKYLWQVGLIFSDVYIECVLIGNLVIVW